MFKLPRRDSGFSGLPSVEQIHIFKDPPKALFTRKSEMVNVAEVMHTANMADRFEEAIEYVPRGINAVPGNGYTNAVGMKPMTFPSRQAYLPYRVAKDGAFRPPLRRQEEDMPVSRQPRLPTSVRTNVGSDISSSVATTKNGPSHYDPNVLSEPKAASVKTRNESFNVPLQAPLSIPASTLKALDGDISRSSTRPVVEAVGLDASKTITGAAPSASNFSGGISAQSGFLRGSAPQVAFDASKSAMQHAGRGNYILPSAESFGKQNAQRSVPPLAFGAKKNVSVSGGGGNGGRSMRGNHLLPTGGPNRSVKPESVGLRRDQKHSCRGRRDCYRISRVQ
jgi:hypothetical protein